jgi:hypothetical protein
MSEYITASWVNEFAGHCGHWPESEVELHIDGSIHVVGGVTSDGRWEQYWWRWPMGDDPGSFAIAKLHVGGYLWIQENAPTTGHGCRCNGSWGIAQTLEQALASLDPENREMAVKWLAGGEA